MNRRLMLHVRWCRPALVAGLLGCCLLAGPLGAQDAEDQADQPESVFMGFAKQFYDWKCDQAASQSLYLNALADREAFERYSLDWYKGLSEPRHFLRIGIGVTYDDKGYDGPLLIVGTGSTTGGSTPGFQEEGLIRPTSPSAIGSGGTASAPVEAPGEAELAVDFLKRYGGSLAEELVAELDKRRKLGKGKFGAVLKAIDDVVVTAKVTKKKESADEPGAEAAADAPEEFVRPQRATAGDDRAAQMQQTEVPMSMAAGQDLGAPAAGATTGAGGEEAGTEEENSGYVIDIDEVGGQPDEEFKTIHPGVVCLNEGTRDQLLERARGQGVDLLFVIDINVRESRGNHYSMTNLRMIDMQEPNDSAAQTKAIKNDVDLSEEDRKGRTVVQAEIEKLFEAVDQNYIATEMPEVLKTKPEHVANRIAKLVAGANDQNRLLVGTEIIGFCREGLLDNAAAASALGQLFEGGGDLLLSGEKDDRLSFLKKIMAEME